MSSDAKPRDGDSLTSMQIKVMAIACAFAIATLYYNQPLLALIGASFGTSDSVTSQIVTLSQIGYSLGLFLFVPLGDRVDPRRLILCLLAANTIGLAACALAPNFTLFAVATLVAGLTTITPQIIIPTVAGLAAPQTRGRTVGILLSGHVGGPAARPDAQRLRRRVRGLALRCLRSRSSSTLCWWRSSGASCRSPNRPPTSRIRDCCGRCGVCSWISPYCAPPAPPAFSAFGAFSTIWATLAFLLAAPPYHFGANMVGMFGLIGVVSIFVAPIVGRITDRLGVRFMIGAGASILILAFAFVSQAEHALWALICGITLIDIGYRAVLLANQTRIYPLQPDFRNRLNTMFMTFVFLGGAVGSLCGAVAARWSWTGVALAGAGLAAAGLLVHLMTSRRRT
jgi:predicted MFS family arabinose efflux permease